MCIKAKIPAILTSDKLIVLKSEAANKTYLTSEFEIKVIPKIFVPNLNRK